MERQAPMKFTDRRPRHRQVTVGKVVEFDFLAHRWVSTKIKLYVGTKALEVKRCP